MYGRTWKKAEWVQNKTVGGKRGIEMERNLQQHSDMEKMQG